ncbi:hypothetical protein GALMADRAFT_68113 [Galerina marginata CBS 339.88]|uniref:Uncharacterized protein n=1 Tax=Galerina marginata (strain CBS 339.88) TaxID=685588 RepID=A0A067SYT1_GALM3|nr:hypothetical protein GALMADRAFT_68113 [Galerina marginata CBS 339.88]
MHISRGAISSTEKGRKPELSLPPNRSRNIQRAFRARHANHFTSSLELRVMELEGENIRLRRAMKLPIVDQPALGSGPTGVNLRYAP